MLECAFRLLASFRLGWFLVLGALGRGGFGRAGTFADAVAYIADRIEAAHVLLLEKIDRITLALAEQRHQHIGTRHFIATRRLDVEDRALHDALEPTRW